jgi:hypothetical protein
VVTARLQVRAEKKAVARQDSCGMKSLGHMSLPTLLSAMGLRRALVSDNTILPPVTRNAVERELLTSSGEAALFLPRRRSDD